MGHFDRKKSKFHTSLSFSLAVCLSPSLSLTYTHLQLLCQRVDHLQHLHAACSARRLSPLHALLQRWTGRSHLDDGLTGRARDLSDIMVGKCEWSREQWLKIT